MRAGRSYGRRVPGESIVRAAGRSTRSPVTRGLGIHENRHVDARERLGQIGRQLVYRHRSHAGHLPLRDRECDVLADGVVAAQGVAVSDHEDFSCRDRGAVVHDQFLQASERTLPLESISRTCSGIIPAA